MNEAALQAELMKQFQAPAPEPGAPAGANPMDPTGVGGGTVGVGMAPLPGEQGFSGNEQPADTQQAQAVGEQQPPMGGIQ